MLASKNGTLELKDVSQFARPASKKGSKRRPDRPRGTPKSGALKTKNPNKAFTRPGTGSKSDKEHKQKGKPDVKSTMMMEDEKSQARTINCVQSTK